ncbi:MAG: hypothetical protein IKT43_02040 [Clostridia bacterium]|nr:hypothetical protein [Clostridia bacterium]
MLFTAQPIYKQSDVARQARPPQGDKARAPPHHFAPPLQKNAQKQKSPPFGGRTTAKKITLDCGFFTLTQSRVIFHLSWYLTSF